VNSRWMRMQEVPFRTGIPTEFPAVEILDELAFEQGGSKKACSGHGRATFSVCVAEMFSMTSSIVMELAISSHGR